MQSSLIETPLHAELLSDLQRILKTEQVEIVARKGGGNSVVFCVEANGTKMAVKSYPPYAPGKRDRLSAEVMVYQFLNEHKVASVPALKMFSEDNRLLMMDWIDGEIPNEYVDQDIDQAIHFLQSIANLNNIEAAKALPQAAEACLSLTTIIDQVAKRLQRLQLAAQHEPALMLFLQEEFIPMFIYCQQAAVDGYQQEGLSIDAELDESKRSLIPADFGFHNTIRDQAGKLYFFDFDYFGWDDPVKLLADILWHPKMQLSQQHRQRFISGVTKVYRNDPDFLTRFNHTLALFGLRWTLIYLNEFIPEFWQNRQHAAVHANHADAKVMQLNRARETLLNVQKIGSFL
jgi:hypothetical protein